MKLAVRVPPLAPVGEYLEILAANKAFAGFEMTGEAANEVPRLEELVESLGIPLLSLDSPVPRGTSRYLAESRKTVRGPLVRHIAQMLEWVAGMDARVCTLDLGVERAPMGDSAALEPHARMLKTLLPTAAQYQMRLCLPLRLPPARSLTMNRRIGSLVRKVMHPSCGLTIEFYPDEYGSGPGPMEVLQPIYPHVAAIRIHYEPALGLRLSDQLHTYWAESLRVHGYNGVVVFCPVITGLPLWRSELQRLKQAINGIWQVPVNLG